MIAASLILSVWLSAAPWQILCSKPGNGCQSCTCSGKTSTTAKANATAIGSSFMMQLTPDWLKRF